MNAIAIYYVNAHLESLREDAAKRRLDHVADGPGLRDRAASAIARIRGAFGPASDPDWSFLPKIHDYPNRG